ncbi:MAG: hypothetical protein J5965_15205 [Aeriscardovia sp.]|nr:hypothetical protein [Aeriscardovia sp.]
MRQRTPSEIKAYGDGYAEAYKEFCHLLERHDKDKAIRKMKIFADAVALTVETATDTADTPQTDLPTIVRGSEVRMLCKDCEYFKIEYQPIKGFDFGRARCTKYDVITDFRDKRKFKWLSCEDRPKESEVEI